MIEKTCRNCNTNLIININWTNGNYKNSGYICKNCQKEFYIKNKDKILKQKKEYNLKNKDKISKQKKEYNLKNKDKISKQKKEYNLKNKEHRKEYNLKNKEHIKDYMLIWRTINIDNIKIYNKNYRNKNPNTIYHKEYSKNYVRTKEYKLYHKIRKKYGVFLSIPIIKNNYSEIISVANNSLTNEQNNETKKNG
jgi:hypothetical protein